MALTSTHRRTREWPLLVLALALVGSLCYPLWKWASTNPLEGTSWEGTVDRASRLLLGPEQVACYCCFIWASFILLSRYWEVNRQRRSFSMGLLPTEEGARILPEDARPLQRKAEQVTGRRPYILANMIRLALGKYAVSKSSQDASETVRTQAEVDQGRLVTSMATVHYLAWAIPAIGFLGTVRGLAMSLTMAGHVDMAIADFLDQATKHLNVAFDCTLIALALSLPLMFMIHSVQRDEEALVIDCQQYCLEHLVIRLCDPQPLPEEVTAPPAGGAAPSEGNAMSLAGLDLNASHVRAVASPEGIPPRPLVLEEGEPALPTAISLHGRHPKVGKAGAGLCREYPHLVCQDFLAHLGDNKKWAAGRKHRLDAGRAVGLVLEALQPGLTGIKGLASAMPSYLNPVQVSLLDKLFQKARLPLLGTLASPLALGLAAHRGQPWTGNALLVDADDHALSWSLLKAGQGQLHVLDGKSWPHLNVRAWKDRLVDGVSEICVHHCRRDPRDSGNAEQLLYDQLDDVLDAGARDQLIEVVIRANQWCQNLILQPYQVQAFCAPLARQFREELEAEWENASPGVNIALILLSEPASRLPGLSLALADLVGGRLPQVSLAADAAARGAHGMAVACQKGEIPRGHLDAVVPLLRTITPGNAEGPVQRVIPIAVVDR